VHGETGEAVELRVRGRVQGVGLRPTIWRFARELGLSGEVLNDGAGVLVRLAGEPGAIDALIAKLHAEPPPLARIDEVSAARFVGEVAPGFRIVDSGRGAAHTQVAPDAAICADCRAEILDPAARRFGYALTNCTHCGPRLSIITGIPYDRAQTTMAGFALCDDCRREYEDPTDRRFHAEAIACPRCGPQVSLKHLGGAADAVKASQAIAAAASLITAGEIVAVKGLGGYQIACDATSKETLQRLRHAKRRTGKPFALMARDLGVIRRYCTVSAEEEAELASPRGPIVILAADGPERLPDAVAPGLDTLGFMLPTTPLHVLLTQSFETPLVMTSGNLSDEPQVTVDAEVGPRLRGIATHALMHNRAISNRLDDSLVRVMSGRARVLRRARGYAPAPIALPQGFETTPNLLAFGSELKATYCLIKDGEATLSQHQGDLEDAATYDSYRSALAFYERLFNAAPRALVVDKHVEYLSAKWGWEEALARGVVLVEAQHHHAHLAACLAENGRTLDSPPVLGIVLDGLGWGDDRTIWGGEFLLGDYLGFERLARLKPVAMPGGVRAIREPWRNLYAHLMSAMGWEAFAKRSQGCELYDDLSRRPRALLDSMIEKGIHAPKASSCGRLFDAVAAAIGVCRERQVYEGEAATRLEALARAGAASALSVEGKGYDLTLSANFGAPMDLDPAILWRELLEDLRRGTWPTVIAARFHDGLARALVRAACTLAAHEGGRRFDTVALSGGCFQNRILFERVEAGLQAEGFTVLSHAEVPANDGGLALGQAMIGAAHLIKTASDGEGDAGSCASAFQAAS
jgi:hydrogenase maturation protein HypF